MCTDCLLLLINMILNMLLMIFLALLCIAIYKFIVKPSFYWKDKGVLSKLPVPLFGHLFKVMLRKQSFYDNALDVYNDFPNARYNGTFQFNEPALVIRDLELIKRIGIKDFDHFTDRRDVGSVDTDPIVFRNVGNLNGQPWKDMRATLSPAFTSSKMRAMFLLITKCAQQMIDHLCSKKQSVTEFEVKELFARYTNDVIATCAFGYECDSLKDKENSFFMMGQDLTSFKGLRAIKFLLANTAPGVLRTFKLSIFPKHITDFFMTIVTKTISYRVEHNVIRPDMIHLLLEARKGKLRHEDVPRDEGDGGFAIVEESGIGKRQVKNIELKDADIAAQAFVFFFAGYEAGSVILSFMSTELALNPDVQEKLFLEVDAVMQQSDGKPSYEDITGMKYLDMVVSETLRKWPVAPAVDRKCTKPYKIPATTPEETDVEINVNDAIFIPILGLHRDEKLYPQPEKFDPSRFSDENKSAINPYSYMPFGIGPRACIGSRFALLEIKVLFTYLLWRFEFVPVAKTSAPIKLSPKSMKVQPENGFWLGLKAR